jgi:hypothetical protein
MIIIIVVIVITCIYLFIYSLHTMEATTVLCFISETNKQIPIKFGTELSGKFNLVHISPI